MIDDNMNNNINQRNNSKRGKNRQVLVLGGGSSGGDDSSSSGGKGPEKGSQQTIRAKSSYSYSDHNSIISSSPAEREPSNTLDFSMIATPGEASCQSCDD